MTAPTEAAACLQLLGPVALHRAAGLSSVPHLTQPRPLAVLSYLVLARPRRLHSRDTLLALLWPEADQARGRHALRNVLHLLRKAIGDEALMAGGDDLVGVAPGGVACDALELEEMVERRRWEAALTLHQGDLFAGFHVSEAPEFEEWMFQERTRFHDLAVRAATELAKERQESGDLAGAIRATERRVQLAPDDEGGQRMLMQLLATHGERPAALRAYDRLSERLRDEYGTEPSRETRELVGALRRSSANLGVARVPEEPAAPAPDVPLLPEARPDASRRHRQVLAGGIAAALAAVGVFTAVSSKRPVKPTTGTLFVVPVVNATGDSTATWLGEGLTISLRDQFRRAGWRLVPDSRVRNALREQPTQDAAARSVGASLVLSGRADSTAGRVRLRLEAIPAGSDKPAAAAETLVPPRRLLEAELGVVSDVIGQLRPGLATDSLAVALGRGTSDDAAYRFFLQGAYLWDRRYSQEDMELASARFDSALAHDPVYADALAARARVRFAMAWSGIGSVEAGLAAARGDARRAVELDSLSRVALSTLGAAETTHDSVAARRLLERAVALDPDRSDTFFLLGLHYAFRGEHAIAERAFHRAIELEPLTPFLYLSLASSQVCQGKFVLALATFSQLRSVTARPDLTQLVNYREAILLLALGRWQDAIPLLQASLQPASPAVRSTLKRARSAKDVQHGLLLNARERIAAEPMFAAAAPWQQRERARLELQAGNQDEAIRLLLASRRPGDASLALACEDPAMQALVRDPVVMAAMRLPQEP